MTTVTSHTPARPRIENGILMGAGMIGPLKAGLKTQARFPITSLQGFGRISEFGPSDTPGYDWQFRDKRSLWNEISSERLARDCPFGRPGDRLWVRETLRYARDPAGGQGPLVYVADGTPVPGDVRGTSRTILPIHMPRRYARYLLEVEQVRIQQVQSICRAEAVAEGMAPLDVEADGGIVHGLAGVVSAQHPIRAFQLWWQTQRGSQSWNDNAWVWAIHFRLLAGEGGA